MPFCEQITKPRNAILDFKAITKGKYREVYDDDNHLVDQYLLKVNNTFVITGLSNDGQIVELTIKNPKQVKERVLRGWVITKDGDAYCSYCKEEGYFGERNCPHCGKQLRFE